MATITKEDLRAELERLAAGELGKTIASHLCERLREDVIKTLRSALDASLTAEFHAPASELAKALDSSERGISGGERQPLHTDDGGSECPRLVLAGATLNEIDSGVRGAVDGPTNSNASGHLRARAIQRSSEARTTLAEIEFDLAEAASNLDDEIPRQLTNSTSFSNYSASNGMRRRHIHSGVVQRAAENQRLRPSIKISASGVDTTIWNEQRGPVIADLVSARGRPMELLRLVVLHPVFDSTTCAVIFANAIVLGMQAEYYSHGDDPDAPAFRGLSIFFCTFFTVEHTMRIAVHRCEFWTQAGWWGWNAFDTILLLLQLLEEIWHALKAEGSQEEGFTFLSFFRLVVSIRVIRVARILRYIGSLKDITSSILKSGLHIFWTVLLLCLLMYIVAVYLTDLVANFAPEHTRLKPHFGSVGSSVVTLFQSITGGLDWSVTSNLLSEEISPIAAVGFYVYIGLVLFVVVNNINGVFVDEALKNSKKNIDIDTFHLAKGLFLQTDVDNSGSLTWEEFESQLDSKAMKKYFDALDLDIAEAKTLFTLIDVDNSGEIDTGEFVNGCFRLRGSAKAIEFAAFLREFYIIADMIKAMQLTFTELFSALDRDVKHCRNATETLMKRSRPQQLQPHRVTPLERLSRGGDVGGGGRGALHRPSILGVAGGDAGGRGPLARASGRAYTEPRQVIGDPAVAAAFDRISRGGDGSGFGSSGGRSLRRESSVITLDGIGEEGEEPEIPTAPPSPNKTDVFFVK